MSSPLVGVWELISDSDDGIALFSDTYYSIVITTKNRATFKTAEPTEAEAAEAYRTLTTAAGTYHLSGTTLVCQRTVNRNPNWTGQDVSFDASVHGDRLTLSGGVNAPSREWKKVE